MVPVSIVIITKNAADIIDGCIEQARQITDDIIIIYNEIQEVDSIDITKTLGCRVYKKMWDGYGANKNKGVDEAKYNWILSIDADEIPDDELINSIHNIDLSDSAVVYDINFRSYFGEKPIRWGSWGRDHHIRLFNRGKVRWSETVVHETLVLPQKIKRKKMDGHLHHYSVKDVNEYDRKGFYYAKLSAKKYFRNGKRTNAIKLYISPVFGFIKSYIVFLGFLDGREGWDIAKTTVKNTRRKYLFLNQMENQPDKRESVKDNLVVEY